VPATAPVEQKVGQFAWSWGTPKVSWGISLYRGGLMAYDFNDHSTPVLGYAQAAFGQGLAKIATTGDTTIVLTRGPNVSVATCGRNNHGELGRGSTTDSSGDENQWFGIKPNWTNTVDASITDISAGSAQAGNASGGTLLARSSISGGTVIGWGFNPSGQLGMGDTTQRTSPTTVWDPASHSGVTIAAVSCGSNHCVLLDTSGGVWTAGDNTHGQLGRGTLGVASTTWGQITGLTQSVVAIATGDQTTLLVMADGTVLACGNGADGRLGGTILGLSGSHTVVPTAVDGIADCVEATQYRRSSWFRTSTGELWWTGMSGIGVQTSVLGSTTNSFGFSWLVDPPAAGVTYSKLGYASGGTVGTEHMMAIGSDGYLYTQGQSGVRGDGVTSFTDVAFERHNQFVNVTAATVSEAAFFVGAGGLSTRYFYPLLHDATDPTYQVRVFRTTTAAPAEPSGWQLNAFDDSTWSPPVVVVGAPAPPTINPLVDATDYAEWIWPVEPEPSNTGAMLVRLKFNFPTPDASAQKVRIFNFVWGGAVQGQVYGRTGPSLPVGTATVNEVGLSVAHGPADPIVEGGDNWMTVKFPQNIANAGADTSCSIRYELIVAYISPLVPLIAPVRGRAWVAVIG
jgi:hypothetical protein